MRRRRAAVFERPRIEFAFDCGSVIDDLQTRAACELAEISWMLRIRRMVQKFRGITFDDPVEIMDAKLMLIDQQSVRRRFALEERDCAFDAKDPADERPNQKRDDAEMSNKKRGVIFFPGPTRERGRGQIRAE